jgi:hypothetical protein
LLPLVLHASQVHSLQSNLPLLLLLLLPCPPVQLQLLRLLLRPLLLLLPQLLWHLRQAAAMALHHAEGGLPCLLSLLLLHHYPRLHEHQLVLLP